MNQATISLLIECVFAPLLASLTAYAIRFIHIKSAEVTNRSNSTVVAHYISILDTTLENVVMAMNQTMVNGMKAASDDGRLTSAEQTMLKNQALTSIYNIIGETGTTILKSAFADLDKLIEVKIDSLVGNLNRFKPTVVTTAVVSPPVIPILETPIVAPPVPEGPTGITGPKGEPGVPIAVPSEPVIPPEEVPVG